MRTSLLYVYHSQWTYTSAIAVFNNISHYHIGQISLKLSIIILTNLHRSKPPVQHLLRCIKPNTPRAQSCSPQNVMACYLPRVHPSPQAILRWIMFAQKPAVSSAKNQHCAYYDARCCVTRKPKIEIVINMASTTTFGAHVSWARNRHRRRRRRDRLQIASSARASANDWNAQILARLFNGLNGGGSQDVASAYCR